MRDFVPGDSIGGHDHFFDAFGKFNDAAPMGEMAADVVDRAGRQRMRYVELMVTFQGSAVRSLADKVAKSQPLGDQPTAFEAALRAAGIEAIVPQARKDIDTAEQRLRELLACDTASAHPGCGVTVRWLQQVSRTMSPPASSPPRYSVRFCSKPNRASSVSVSLHPRTIPTRSPTTPRRCTCSTTCTARCQRPIFRCMPAN